MQKIWLTIIVSLLVSAALAVAEPTTKQSPDLSVRLLSPSFRNSIQSRDPDKNLWLSGSAGRISKSARVKVNLAKEGKSTLLWRKTVAVGSNGSFEFKTSLSTLPIGEYTVRVELADRGKIVGSHQEAIRVLAPAPMEVTFDYKHVCYIDGKPYFPIGLFHLQPGAIDNINAGGQKVGLPPINWRDALKSVKARGFNCVVYAWSMATDEYLQFAKDIGIYVIPSVGGPAPNEFPAMVSTANKYRNVPVWYGIDEPTGDEMVKQSMDAKTLFMKCDPHRPTMASYYITSLFGQMAKIDDIMMEDPYTIREIPMELVSDWIDEGVKACDDRLPTWVTVQSFACDVFNKSEPTNEELRCQAYLSIVHGATGIFWYSFWTHEEWSKSPKGRGQWYLPDSALWDYFPKLNAEMQSFAPVIFKGEPLGSAVSDTTSVHSRVWKCEGRTYVVAVNHTHEPVTCTLSKLKGGSVEVMFEGRQLSMENGGLRDSFKPLEVHVYKL